MKKCCRQDPNDTMKKCCRQGPKGTMKICCRQGHNGSTKHFCRQRPNSHKHVTALGSGHCIKSTPEGSYVYDKKKDPTN